MKTRNAVILAASTMCAVVVGIYNIPSGSEPSTRTRPGKMIGESPTPTPTPTPSRLNQSEDEGLSMVAINKGAVRPPTLSTAFESPQALAQAEVSPVAEVPATPATDSMIDELKTVLERGRAVRMTAEGKTPPTPAPLVVCPEASPKAGPVVAQASVAPTVAPKAVAAISAPSVEVSASGETSTTSRVKVAPTPPRAAIAKASVAPQPPKVVAKASSAITVAPIVAATFPDPSAEEPIVPSNLAVITHGPKDAGKIKVNGKDAEKDFERRSTGDKVYVAGEGDKKLDLVFSKSTGFPVISAGVPKLPRGELRESEMLEMVTLTYDRRPRGGYWRVVPKKT